MYMVSIIANPLRIFMDPSVLNSWGASNALVPFQLLSYWIDMHLFGPFPFPVYVHNVLSFLVVTLLLYAVLLQCTRDRFAALSATLLWMILPSTLAVHQFISTRHYMEGLLFALAMIYVTFKSLEQEKRISVKTAVLISGLGLIGMLCKEIYATTIPTFLAMIGLWRRRYALVVLGICLTVIYATYRLTFLGGDLTYTMEFVSGREYLFFLSKIPYALTASPLGYLLYGAIGILTGLNFWRNGRKAIWPTLLFVALMAVTFLALYPVTWAFNLVYDTPGVWYRVPFLVNTWLVIYGTWLLHQLVEQPTLSTILVLITFLILPSVEMTRWHWQTTVAQAETEGMFYINNPDKLLYSQAEALWFIQGVHELYNVPQKHYIHKYYPFSPLSQTMIRQYDTIWRAEGDHYVADDTLFQSIVRDHIVYCTVFASDSTCLAP